MFSDRMPPEGESGGEMVVDEVVVKSYDKTKSDMSSRELEYNYKKCVST